MKRRTVESLPLEWQYWIFARPLEAHIQYSRTITWTREFILRNVLFVLMHHFTWSTTVRKHSYSQLKYLIKINWSMSVFLHENSVLYVHYLVNGYAKWYHHKPTKGKMKEKTTFIRYIVLLRGNNLYKVYESSPNLYNCYKA